MSVDHTILEDIKDKQLIWTSPKDGWRKVLKQILSVSRKKEGNEVDFGRVGRTVSMKKLKKED